MKLKKQRAMSGACEDQNFGVVRGLDAITFQVDGLPQRFAEDPPPMAREKNFASISAHQSAIVANQNSQFFIVVFLRGVW
jgi:hypothetical protein